MSLIEELKRRNVVRVGIAYAVVAWVLAQLAEFAFENFGAPDWVLKAFVVVLLLGLPLALFFAWAFEITPEGVRRDRDVDGSAPPPRAKHRVLNYVTIAGLAVALGYFVWERQVHRSVAESAAETAAVAAEQAGPDPRSIAVLPFVNMSSDEEQEWFSDGLTEELLNALARTPDLLVAARTSSFKFKNSTEDVPTIAAALGVAHVLEGSVRRDENRLRVTAQLIRASDGFHLWSQTYDRNPDDVISIQEEVAIEIATALETAMDPDALANMVSSGTRSVKAYNAYLQGLAYGISTINTGDTYTFLSARDAFLRAIEADPEFALAYWELAKFWNVQLQATNIVSGIIELPYEDMRAQFDEAIANAIRTERDPVNSIRYRVLQAEEYLRFDQALRLNTDYLRQRPNDQGTQNQQLGLLAAMHRDEELLDAIKSFHERDGYDIIVVQNSMTLSLISDDKAFIRSFAMEALQRFADSAFGVYQAHRSLLWAGDIDGASRLMPRIATSDLPEDTRYLAALRQACADNDQAEASRIYDRLTELTDDMSIRWISSSIIGRQDVAYQTLAALDAAGDVTRLSDLLSYAYFDPRPFPNLMALLESQGIQPRVPREIPYRCRT